MTLPKCHHKGCREASAYYLSEKNLYLWQHHRFTQYPNEDSVPLVDDSTVDMNLKTIEIWRKDFLASTQMLNEGSIPPDEDDLSTTVREELQLIFDELNEVQETSKYYKLSELLNKTLKIKDVLQQDPLYIEHLVAKTWYQYLSTVKGESLKSSELAEMELKDKYDTAFDTTSEKFNKPEPKIVWRNQEEIEGLNSKLTLERSMPESLNKELEDQHKGHEDELLEKKTHYEHKANQLEQKISDFNEIRETLEENLPGLTEESKRKDTVLKALQDENNQACQELRRAKCELEESKQSVEKLTEKLNEEITRSKDQQALLDKQKDLHAQSMAELEEAKDTALQALQDTLSAKDEELEKILQNHKDEISEINDAKEEELKKSEQEKENLKIDRDNLKKELISKLNLSECSDLSLFYKITTGEEEQIGPETWLELNLNNPKHLEFLSSLTRRMPDIDTLELDNIPQNCQEAKTFLATHFPDKVDTLSFNCDSALSSCLPFYMEELMGVSKRVAEQLFLFKFEVSQNLLVALFSANRHKKWFGFLECKLDLSSVPDFGGTLTGSKLEGLDLASWGGSSYGEWGNNESHFENLVIGLSREKDFRENLKKIWIDECGMEKSDVEKVLEDHGFEHVEIVIYSK